MRNERRYEVSGELERDQSDTDNKEAFLPQEEGSTPFDSPLNCASHLGTDSRPFVDRSSFPFQISTSRYASAELIGAFDEMRLETEPPHQQSESAIHTSFEIPLSTLTPIISCLSHYQKLITFP